MKHIVLAFIFFTLGCGIAQAQYATTHHIAPAPWQYWSDANEAVISTLSQEEVTISLYKSDGTFLDNLTLPAGTDAISYRFNGTPNTTPRNQVGDTNDDRGLIVQASARVMVNLRNVASDIAGTNNANIKGNASLVSFGNEGAGREFRLGYYRSSYGGLNTGNPIYSVMAVENSTNVLLDGALLATLQAGQSYTFNAPIGALMEADKPVVATVGSYGDTPTGCGGNGEDGTFTQLPPVEVLSTEYLVVRGNGANNLTANAPEQTTIVATENNTTVTVTNHDPAGNPVGAPIVYTLANAGDFESFHHGNGTTQYSSSFITSDRPIAVYAGTAVGCETDISTVLPVGGCSGINDIRTERFVDYNGNILPYFCFIVLESATEPVFFGTANIETLTGNPRVAIGTTGFYMLRFDNIDVGDANPIHIHSEAKLTTSIVQQGVGYSMSGFFSAFNEQLEAPEFDIEDCDIVLVAEEGVGPYTWYLNGEPIPGEDTHEYAPIESGNYSVSGTRLCGETLQSETTYVPYAEPLQLDLGGDRIFCEIPFSHTLVGTPQNISEIEDTINFAWYQDGILLTHTGSVMTVSEPGTYTVFVRYDNLDCEAQETVTITATEFELDLDDDYERCDQASYTITPQISSQENIDPTEVEYLWNTGADTETLTVTETGLYELTITYQGCSETRDVYVELNESPEITVSDDVTKCPDEEVILSVTLVNDLENVDYYWFYGSNGTDLIANQVTQIAVTEFGTYRVEAHNGDCWIDATVEVLEYTNNPGCVITQGLSPEGSASFNDQMDLTFLANRTGIASLQVYNRYGSLVYEKDNYVSEWEGQTTDGANLPTGTYYYIINLAGNDAQYGNQHTGWVYINRGIE